MSFYVNKNKRGGWSLIQESYKDGKKIRQTIPKKNYFVIGFNPEWPLEDARSKAKNLNDEETLKKQNAKERIDRQNLSNNVYVPNNLVENFLQNKLLKITTKERHKTIKQHWSTVEKILRELKLKPNELGKHTDDIFLKFEAEQFSPDYSTKLLRVINLWIEFCADHAGQIYKIVKFENYQRDRIRRANQEKDEAGKEATPFTPKILNDAKPKFENKFSYKNNKTLLEQWNWLYASLWFGLRPAELDNLLDSKTLDVRHNSETGIDELCVKQSKLKFSRKELQTKVIPVFTPEQQFALKLIKDKACERPLVKTIQDIFGAGYNTYSGRKGFTDLMLDQGWAIEDCAQMLGHSKLDTLFKHYKNKRRYRLPKAS